MTEEEVESEIIEKGLNTAPRVTLQKIDVLEKSLTYQYHQFSDTTYIVCIAIMATGFVIASGYSACVNSKNFDEELGKKIAKERACRMARDKLWELEGYHLMMSQQEVK